ncbi:MAG: phosphodiester glycosidase family protein [Chloroflexota bacterium]
MSPLRRPRLAVALAAVLGILPAATHAEVTRPWTETRTRTLAPGIVHATGTMETRGGLRQAVQVATIDLADPTVRLRALLSNDRVLGLERPSLLAERKSTPAARAIVATNGDVSVAGAWDALAAPLSLHVADGEVMVAQECATPTLSVDANGTARIGTVKVLVRVDLGYRIPGTWREEIQVKGVNTERRADEAILYTPRFGGRTPTDARGTEAILAVADTLPPSGSICATVVDVRRDAGRTPLAAGRFVLSGSGSVAREVALLAPGDTVTIRTDVVPRGATPCGPTDGPLAAWGSIVDAIGGNHYVARDGRNAAPTTRDYPKGAELAPRTSVGVTADGRVLLVVVDGRQPGYSVGVTLREMGTLMLRLGAVSAFNLDGGGSSVMATRRPGAPRITVSNRPSDGSERALTQALAIFSSAP